MQDLIRRQRAYFDSGATRSVAFRRQALQKLKSGLKAMESELFSALKSDLAKSDFEAYISELGFAYTEIDHALSHVAAWMRPQRVSTPWLLLPSSSRIVAQPKGVVLIIGPWNYPLMLLVAPLIGAIAAGNCSILKPSEIAPATAAAIERLVASVFPPEFCAVVSGGVSETTALLRERFDHIFFTGSIPVGRVVMRAAAEHLTPVTLELGGKSPCFVDHDIDLDVTARRIVWGKFLNAGQTCVAPDYLLVHRKVKQALMPALVDCVRQFFGDDPQHSPDYGRIVSERHFDRLAAMISGELVVGGKIDRATRYIAPTIIDQVTLSDKVMEEEIFGPILPVITYENLDEAMQIARAHPHPLACYVFTRNAGVEQRIVNELSFGGGCINNTLIHLSNPDLPFGGVGPSGLGAYHGQASFDLFTHKKSVVKTSTAIDIRVKYPPYRRRLKLLKALMS